MKLIYEKAKGYHSPKKKYFGNLLVPFFNHVGYYVLQKPIFALTSQIDNYTSFSIMILENYQTARLQFRSLSLLDKEPLMAFFNDPKATAYLSINSEDVNNYANVWIERQQKRYNSIGVGLCAVELKDTGELIGQCGLVWQFVDGIPKWEVGYHLLPRFWGNGYATEAAIACRDFCFENEMAETLISLTDPKNLRSIAVAKRNGMCFWKETVFKGIPVHVYKIRREDWEKIVK